MIITLDRQDVTTALDAAGIDEEDYSLRYAYSGRGMYGSACAAVDIPSGKFATFVTALALQFAQGGRDDQVLDLAEHVRTDTAGRDGITVYWPEVTFAD
ncbi:hypothetical protein [Streptomyces cavernae]|uniref:hypothetical protein n=1 Tax=Streptomyces cavernae TaxID=2259034 RepID=UPI000FEBBD45|nr:hypothetical protein [Streptomyces cavernae]